MSASPARGKGASTELPASATPSSGSKPSPIVFSRESQLSLAAKRTLLVEGVCAWARVDGFPWWPTLIRRRSELEPVLTSEDALPAETQDNRLVEFFNDNNRIAVIHVSDMEEYTSSMILLEEAGTDFPEVLAACVETDAFIRTSGQTFQRDCIGSTTSRKGRARKRQYDSLKVTHETFKSTFTPPANLSLAHPQRTSPPVSMQLPSPPWALPLQTGSESPERDKEEKPMNDMGQPSSLNVAISEITTPTSTLPKVEPTKATICDIAKSGAILSTLPDATTFQVRESQASIAAPLESTTPAKTKPDVTREKTTNPKHSLSAVTYSPKVPSEREESITAAGKATERTTLPRSVRRTSTSPLESTTSDPTRSKALMVVAVKRISPKEALPNATDDISPAKSTLLELVPAEAPATACAAAERTAPDVTHPELARSDSTAGTVAAKESVGITVTTETTGCEVESSSPAATAEPVTSVAAPSKPGIGEGGTTGSLSGKEPSPLPLMTGSVSGKTTAPDVAPATPVTAKITNTETVTPKIVPGSFVTATVATTERAVDCGSVLEDCFVEGPSVENMAAISPMKAKSFLFARKGPTSGDVSSPNRQRPQAGSAMNGPDHPTSRSTGARRSTIPLPQAKRPRFRSSAECIPSRSGFSPPIPAPPSPIGQGAFYRSSLKSKSDEREDSKLASDDPSLPLHRTSTARWRAKSGLQLSRLVMRRDVGAGCAWNGGLATDEREEWDVVERAEEAVEKIQIFIDGLRRLVRRQKNMQNECGLLNQQKQKLEKENKDLEEINGLMKRLNEQEEIVSKQWQKASESLRVNIADQRQESDALKLKVAEKRNMLRELQTWYEGMRESCVELRSEQRGLRIEVQMLQSNVREPHS